MTPACSPMLLQMTQKTSMTTHGVGWGVWFLLRHTSLSTHELGVPSSSAHLAVAHSQPRNTGNEDNLLYPTFCLLTWHSKVHQRKRQARKECKIPRAEVAHSQETTEGQEAHTWEASKLLPFTLHVKLAVFSTQPQGAG